MPHAPTNNAGLSLPPPTQEPPSAQDVGASIDYVCRLWSMSRIKLITPPSLEELGEAAQHAYRLIAQRSAETRPAWADAFVEGMLTGQREAHAVLLAEIKKEFEAQAVLLAEIKKELEATNNELRRDIRRLTAQRNVTHNLLFDGVRVPFGIVPNADGDMPPAHLPPLSTVHALQALTHAQLLAYLDHYELDAGDQTTDDVRLKTLALHIGCRSPLVIDPVQSGTIGHEDASQ